MQLPCIKIFLLTPINPPLNFHEDSERDMESASWAEESKNMEQFLWDFEVERAEHIKEQLGCK
jgi:hypothetical protein